MTTYSVRCRVRACRHRRVIKTHPDEYKVVPKCEVCGSRKGWVLESRAYNKKNKCRCQGPLGRDANPFPHNTTHPMCDQNPRGFYNQAKRQGVTDDEMPPELLGRPVKQDEGCPF